MASFGAYSALHLISKSAVLLCTETSYYVRLKCCGGIIDTALAKSVTGKVTEEAVITTDDYPFWVEMDYWRLCDELSVVQAALLIVGTEPSSHQQYVLEIEPNNRPLGFDAAIAALTHAILAGRLKATIRRKAWERGWNEEAEDDENIGRDERGIQIVYKADPDWHQTTIALEDLQMWLRSRGINSGFFFPEKKESRVAYLDPANPNYSPKLAAAISAWEAVSGDESSTRGKTIKQAIIVWLRKNAARFGLTNEDGNPNKQGIEEVAKIANWDTKGGAPKTPGE